MNELLGHFRGQSKVNHIAAKMQDFLPVGELCLYNNQLVFMDIILIPELKFELPTLCHGGIQRQIPRILPWVSKLLI